MGIKNYIKEIGRGREGARSLSRVEANDLLSQVLDGRVSDLELGAFALAMRIKGETVDELQGFVDAVHARCLPLLDGRPAIVLPSYNGSRRIANLSALLALLLAQRGIVVLMHGPQHDPARVTSAQVWAAFGLREARDAAEVGAAWQRREPAFIGVDALCPALARLLDVRWVVGLRNSGHTVAKLLAPGNTSRALRVVNTTHPEYASLLSSFVQAGRIDAMLLRGTEGEPVADARRAPRMDVYLDGELRGEFSVPAQEGPLATLPVLPAAPDAASTAAYLHAVLEGRVVVPAAIEQQVDSLARALAARADRT